MRSRIIYFILFRCTLNTPLATIEKKINDFYFQVSRAESNLLLGEVSRSHRVVVNCRRFCFHRGQQTGTTAKEWLYPSLLLAQCTSWLWCAQNDCGVPSLLQSVYLYIFVAVSGLFVSLELCTCCSVLCSCFRPVCLKGRVVETVFSHFVWMCTFSCVIWSFITCSFKSNTVSVWNDERRLYLFVLVSVTVKVAGVTRKEQVELLVSGKHVSSWTQTKL